MSTLLTKKDICNSTVGKFNALGGKVDSIEEMKKDGMT